MTACRTTILFPDLHLGSHDERALRCALKLTDWLSPDRVVILGDWLDCHAASSHPASDRREEQAASYAWEVGACRTILAELEGLPGVGEIVYLEGNHEQRVERWAVNQGALGRSLADVGSPRAQLSRDRASEFRWVPYKAEGQPNYVEVADGLIACHGWSTAQHAAAAHLRRSHGLSVIHGHTHRRQTHVLRHPLTGRPIEAHSPGCLARLQPLWVSGPTNWTHGVSILQERGDLWALYHVPIVDGRAVTPCGATFDAGDRRILGAVC